MPYNTLQYKLPEVRTDSIPCHAPYNTAHHTLPWGGTGIMTEDWRQQAPRQSAFETGMQRSKGALSERQKHLRPVMHILALEFMHIELYLH